MSDCFWGSWKGPRPGIRTVGVYFGESCLTLSLSGLLSPDQTDTAYWWLKWNLQCHFYLWTFWGTHFLWTGAEISGCLAVLVKNQCAWAHVSPGGIIPDAGIFLGLEASRVPYTGLVPFCTVSPTTRFLLISSGSTLLPRVLPAYAIKVLFVWTSVFQFCSPTPIHVQPGHFSLNVALNAHLLKIFLSFPNYPRIKFVCLNPPQTNSFMILLTLNNLQCLSS